MISTQAFIAQGAKIGENVKIYPFAYIEEDVVIGDNCVIYPYVSIMNGSRLGRNNIIYQNAVIGATPQDFFWKGEQSQVVIGDHNVIRENVVISRANTSQNITKIGNRNVIMEGTHISHNTKIGDECVFGYAVKIASDCEIANNVIFSSNVVAKPFCKVGELAFILTGCRFGEDIPPYIMVKNNPIEYAGLHAGVLSYAKLSESVQRHLANAYRLVFNSKVSLFDAIKQIEAQVPDGKEVRKVIEFLKQSEGIITKQKEE